MATTQTDKNGAFAIATRQPGRYRLRLHLPAGTAATGGNAGVTSQRYIEVDGQTLFTADVGQSLQLQNLNLQLSIPASIVGSLDVSGRQDVLDFGQLAVDLLDPQGRHIARTHIEADGSYRFINPMISQRGNYTLRIYAPEGNAPAAVDFQDITIELYPGHGAGMG